MGKVVYNTNVITRSFIILYFRAMCEKNSYVIV